MLSHKQNIGDDIISIESLLFELQGLDGTSQG